jgi:luciferase family oxidoreductase group 1
VRPIRLSVLDLVPVPKGCSERDALRRSVELATRVETLKFIRYWFAEHHSSPGIASSSPQILSVYVASQTERIRVGAGGVMLPNHAPLQVAESFKTLEALFPRRIDLGIGRGVGGNSTVAKALRSLDPQQFPDQLRELISLSNGTVPPKHELTGLQAIPASVTLPPIWVLGTSGASAMLAGILGTGYAYAGHFATGSPAEAFASYRQSFRPSQYFPKPHTILSVSMVCAETSRKADHLLSSMLSAIVSLRRGKTIQLEHPSVSMRKRYSTAERQIMEEAKAIHFAGPPKKARDRILHLVEETGADEIMISSMIYSHSARLRSYELIADALRSNAAKRG